MTTEKIFAFDMRQVVYYKPRTGPWKYPGTIIGRAQHLQGEPTYLVRPFHSESRTEGAAIRESQLVAF